MEQIKPVLSSEDVIKIIDYLAERAQLQNLKEAQKQYRSFTHYQHVEELHIEIFIEESKRQDDIFFNTGVEPYAYEECLEYYMNEKKGGDMEVV